MFSAHNRTLLHVGMWSNEVLLSFEEVVVKGVHVNINSSGCSREEACPLPGKKAENGKVNTGFAANML